MSQIEAQDSTRFLKTGRSRRDVANVTDILARAGAAPELGNLIQIAASAINIIARDPDTRSIPELKPVISSATIALRKAGLIVKEAIPGAERAEAVVRRERAASSPCHLCPKKLCPHSGDCGRYEPRNSGAFKL